MNTDLADSSEYAGVGHHLQDKSGFKQTFTHRQFQGQKLRHDVEVFGYNIHYGKIFNVVKII